MFSKFRISTLGGAAIVVALALPAIAQQAANPADPAVSVPATQYQSAFGDYRKPQFEQKLDWRQANDAVRDVGGHMGALKDAPASTGLNRSSAPAAPAAGPAAGGHAGHRQ